MWWWNLVFLNVCFYVFCFVVCVVVLYSLFWLWEKFFRRGSFCGVDEGLYGVFVYCMSCVCLKVYLCFCVDEYNYFCSMVLECVNVLFLLWFVRVDLYVEVKFKFLIWSELLKFSCKLGCYVKEWYNLEGVENLSFGMMWKFISWLLLMIEEWVWWYGVIFLFILIFIVFVIVI